MITTYRVVLVGILLLTLIVQFDLWTGHIGLPVVWQMDDQLRQVEVSNQQLIDKNARLVQDIYAFKVGHEAIETRARMDLGMIKLGETFFYFDPAH